MRRFKFLVFIFSISLAISPVFAVHSQTQSIGDDIQFPIPRIPEVNQLPGIEFVTPEKTSGVQQPIRPTPTRRSGMRLPTIGKFIEILGQNIQEGARNLQELLTPEPASQSVSKSITNVQQKPQTAIQTSQPKPKPTPEPAAVIQTIIREPRIISLPAPNLFEEQFNNLKLTISKIEKDQQSQYDNLIKIIGQSGKINSLGYAGSPSKLQIGSPTLNDPYFTGTATGIGDDDIPDDITVSSSAGGSFAGDVTITGNLTVGTGTITINGNANQINTATGTLLFQASGNTKVGIGTTTPGVNAGFGVATSTFIGGNLTVGGSTGSSTIQSNLDVLGSLSVGALCINCGGGGGFTGGTTTVTNLIVTNTSTSTFVGPIVSNAGGGRLIVAGATTTGELWFNPYGGAVHMASSTPSSTLLANGVGFSVSTTTYFGKSVGIGTTTPLVSNALGIGGNLYVHGSVTAFRGVPYTWPSADGTSGQVLQTNGATTLSWAQGSQWVTSGDNIYYATGNVGIGTTTPNNRLQITATTSPNLLLTDYNGGPNLKHVYASSSAGDLAFGILADNLTTYSERLRMTNTGRLGIGTTSPAANLSINQNAGEIALMIGSSTASNFIIDESGNVYTRGRLRIGAGPFPETNEGQSILHIANSFGGILYVNGTNGRVGISTTNPGGKLSVPDMSIGANYLGTAPPSNSVIIEGSVGIGTTSPGNLLSVAGSAVIQGPTTLYNSVTLPSLVATSTATSTFAGPLAAATTGNGNLIIAGATTTGQLLLNPYGGVVSIGIGANTTATSSASSTQLFIPGSVPLFPVGQASTGSSAGAYRVYAQGRYIYVINNTSSTFQIFNFSTSSPSLISSVTIGISSPTALYVQGRYAYILSSGNDSMQIFDVSNPKLPILVGSIGAATGSGGVYVQGRYAYVVDTSAGGSNKFMVFDISNTITPTLVGMVNSGGFAIQVRGRYAYVTENVSGGPFKIFDISNPAAPNQIASLTIGNTPQGLYIQNQYAYIVNTIGNTLQIIDISNPYSPSSVSTFTTNTTPRQIYVQGRYAYIVNSGSNNLQIIDVSNPLSPYSVGSATTQAGAFGLFIQGRYAYVVNNTGNTLQVFDIGGAYVQQLEVGGLETGTLQVRNNLAVSNDLDVQGGLTVGMSVLLNGAFAINSSNGIATSTIFTVDAYGRVGIGTSTPISVSTTTPFSSALQIVSSSSPNLVLTDIKGGTDLKHVYASSSAGDLAFGTLNDALTTYSERLRITNAGNLGIGTTTPGNTLSVNGSALITGPLTTYGALTLSSIVSTSTATSTFAGPLAAATTGNGNLIIAGATTTGQLLLNPWGGTVTIGTSTTASSASSTQLFVIGRVPLYPVASTTTGTTPIDMFVQGRYIYTVNTGSDTLQIFEHSTSSPSLISSTAMGSDPSGIYVAGRYAYIVISTTKTLQIVDVSNPKMPILLGSVSTGSSGYSNVRVSGRYAFIATSSGGGLVSIIDVANPSKPTITATVTVGDSGLIDIQGRYLYTGGGGTGDTLYIYDISNPNVAPSLVGSVGLGGGPLITSIYVKNEYAYLSRQLYGSGNELNNDLVIIDVRNPASPVKVGDVNLGAGVTPSDVYVQGRYAYVTDSALSTLFVTDVSDVTAPFIAGVASTTNPGNDIHISGRYAYITSGSGNSLQVYDLGGAYIQQLEAGGFEVGTLQVQDELLVNNNLDIRNGLTVGGTSLFNGPIAVQTVNGLATTSAFVVDSNGRVGISTSTPNNSLQVVASTSPNLVLTDIKGGPDLKHVYASSSAGDLAFGTLNDALATYSEKLRITNAGNLGIGTTSPYAKLSVVGEIVGANFTATTSATSTFAGPLAAATTGNGQLIVAGATTTGALWLNPYGGAVHMASATPSSTLLANGIGFSVSTTTYFGQSVGIGTTTPLVSNALGIGGNLYVHGSVTAFRGVPYTWPSADGTASQLLQTNGSGVLSWATVSGSSQWTTSGSDIYYATGNVGIGTTTPTATRFQIAATTSPNLLLTDYNGGPDLKHFYASSSAGDLAFGTLNDALTTYSERLRITNAGNLGIGTTSPYAVLSVVGATGVVAQQFTATSTTATTTFAGPVGIGTTTPTILSPNVRGLAIDGSLYVSGTTTVPELQLSGEGLGLMGSSTPRANTLYKENIVKGWIMFDGAAATPVVQDSFNVSSITDNGVGQYTLNWKTFFKTNYYSFAGSCRNASGSGVLISDSSGLSYLSNGGLSILCRNGIDSGQIDGTIVTVIAIGNQ